MSVRAPKGTKDMLPKDSYRWHYIEEVIRDLAKDYGLSEIRTPVFESTELFERGVGDTTDIVQKEMYTFMDKGDRSITLKAEGTAPVARAYIENGLHNDVLPLKMYYITPVFRYERPQAGRLRQHHQFGVEIFGSDAASVDAEVISVALELFRRLGINGLNVNINSIGCNNCKASYNKALKDYLLDKLPHLCETCKTRFHKNPMRIIDCKVPTCQETIGKVPYMIDYLDDDCRDHFEKLKKYLSVMGIDYEVDPKIVRGLDYYNKTAFEIIYTGIGAQGTVCGGGRYDGLVESIGGSHTPAVGFGMGIERLLLTLDGLGIEIPLPKDNQLYIASLGDRANDKAIELSHAIRKRGINAEVDHLDRSLKAQLKYADKLGFRYVVVLGDEEIDSDKAFLKDMQNGESREVSVSEIPNIMEGLKC